MQLCYRRLAVDALVFLLTLLHAFAAASNEQVLLVVLDGFRHDYLDRFTNLSSFRALRERATRMPAFIPEMPTQCFPNFYSLFTGQTPLDHGLVANNMFDSSNGLTFLGGVAGNWSDNSWWNRAEPIWVTAKRKAKRVALFSWPTCDLQFFSDAHRADRCQPYREFGNDLLDEEVVSSLNLNCSESGQSHIAMSASQFRLDLVNAVDELRKGTNLVAVFTDLVDILGHMYGPESPALSDALQRELESPINRLLFSLDQRFKRPDGSFTEPLSDAVNVVMLSDHGMSSLLFEPNSGEEPRTIDISQFWKNSEVLQTLDGGAYVSVYPKEQIAQSTGGLDQFVSRLQQLMKPAQREIVVFKTRDVLISEMQQFESAEFEFTSSRTFSLVATSPIVEVDAAVQARLAPLVATSKRGWFMKTNKVKRVPRYGDGNVIAKGWHGYDARDADMWGLFLAFGPAFEPDRVIEPVVTTNHSQSQSGVGYLRTRDAYLLLARLLNIEPLPNRASHKRVSYLFASETKTVSMRSAVEEAKVSFANRVLCSVAAIIGLIVVVMGVFCVPWCRRRSQLQVDFGTSVLQADSKPKLCSNCGCGCVWTLPATAKSCLADDQYQLSRNAVSAGGLSESQLALCADTGAECEA